MKNKNKQKNNARLTGKGFWDHSYDRRSDMVSFDKKNWKNYVSVQIFRKLTELEPEGKRILEIGGGDAKMLCYIAQEYLESRCAVVDFSPSGCQRARERAQREGVDLDVFQTDMFDPPEELINAFDVVISHGVVEHFQDLGAALAAKKSFVKSDGTIFTIIPNYSPVYKYLCKRWSPQVLEMHVLHDMDSFIQGHKEAGLKVLEAGYLGSIEFSRLSMAIKDMKGARKFDRLLYLWLTRISKAIHYLEFHWFNLPASQCFSPFIYVVSTSKKTR